MQLYTGSHEDIQGMSEHLMKVQGKGILFRGVIASDDNLALGAIKYAHTAGACHHRLQQFPSGRMLQSGAYFYRQQTGNSVPAFDYYADGSAEWQRDA